MMKHGKQTCRILKEIRKEIAKANDIEFIVSECQHKGDCSGTCPKCESEVRYLEQQLGRKRLLGKAVTVMGVSMSFSALTACNYIQKGISIIEGTEASVTFGEVIPKEIDFVEEIPPIMGEIIEGEIAADIDTIPPSDALMGVVEEMPEYPGGMIALMAFLNETTRYPDNVEKQIEGRVTVQFIVQPDGNVTDPKILRSLGSAFDEEVLRVVGLFPKWKPGKMRGKEIPVKYTLPVMFRIPE
ncbi:energy transducer TonB [Bacteroides sp. UBA939]|uniref:energy transducer TonB n=1 Tax=Bacteroides sp. UBA939 TaxID=1946092 RepID=UPI0025C41DBF|nr:energy transducer TonB [Bacteroides sp. UBA939]